MAGRDTTLLIPAEQLLDTPNDVWSPSKHKLPPEPPPPPPEMPISQEMAAAQGIDGKLLLKKTKPRRTVDYFGPMGRWFYVCQTNYMLFPSANSAFSYARSIPMVIFLIYDQLLRISLTYARASHEIVTS